MVEVVLLDRWLSVVVVDFRGGEDGCWRWLVVTGVKIWMEVMVRGEDLETN